MDFFPGHPHFHFLCRPYLPVQIHRRRAVAKHTHPVRAEVAYEFRQLPVAAVFIFSDDAGNLKERHLFHQQHVQQPVRRIGIRHGIEAAAVVASVAHAHEGLLGVYALPGHLHNIVLRDALEKVDERGQGVGVEPVEKG